jgi:hypothetical protein
MLQLRVVNLKGGSEMVSESRCIDIDVKLILINLNQLVLISDKDTVVPSRN